nr:hypothetical protein KPHV_00680 [Kitasatospora purpeofusca]
MRACDPCRARGARAWKPPPSDPVAALLEGAVLTGELLDAGFEGGVRCGQGLDGFAGNHLLAVADLTPMSSPIR